MDGVRIHEPISQVVSLGTATDATVDVVTFGEPLICLTAATGRLPSCQTLIKSVGGAECNVAIGLSRLGLRVRLLGRVGNDPFGEEAIRTLRGEDVDVQHLARSSTRPTALLIKERHSAEDVHVYYYRNGSAGTEFSAADVPAGLGAAGRHVHLSGVTLVLGAGPRAAADALLREAKAAGRTVSFDPNFRLKLADIDDCVRWSRDVLPFVDHLLLGEDEARALSGTDSLETALDALEATGVAHVVIRRGPRGAIGTDGRTRHETPAPNVTVVDTVGAGDAFTTGYLYETLCGRGLEQAMETGAWTAGRVVGHVGDYEGLPMLEDYRAWRSDRPRVSR